MYSFIKYFFTAIAIFAPSLILAQEPIAKLAPPAPGVGATLEDFIGLLIEIIQAVAFPALVVSIIYAGYILLTAGGNEAQISKAKVWIMWTLIGAAIVIAAQVIADTVFNTAAEF